MKEKAKPGLRYRFICRDPQGRMKWAYVIHNLIPDQGMNYHINQFYLGHSWYLGLIKSGAGGSGVSFDESDTAAKITTTFPANPPTTNGWAEEINVAPGRQLLVFTNTTVPTGSGVALSAALVFTFSGSGHLGGGFVSTDPAQGGTSGILYSEAGGGANLAYAPGDTCTATVEFDLTRPVT